MKPINIQFDHNGKEALYMQLYRYLKSEITCGNIEEGEKLPSLRKIASDLSISITTADLAYSQLVVEGYIFSRPQSGYYAAGLKGNSETSHSGEIQSFVLQQENSEAEKFKYDLSCFDFNKWKKCTSKILNEYKPLLLFESDPQGERALRNEIAKYVYSSRGVTADPDQIVIGAGTQQLTNHICRIMKKMNIGLLATEDPGYISMQNIFRDHGFNISKIPVAKDGIVIEKLPSNIPVAVYVSPSNQFPTGSVMPVGRRYELLEWAKENKSFILEDDYDSELRYFGKPVPALQGLDRESRVVYFGSFSSTLFPAIKISYMVLPDEMVKVFSNIKSDYTQTCSKTEQLTLAMFMEEGHYYTHIKKLRKNYANKLQLVLNAFEKYGKNIVTPVNTNSGINLIIKVKSGKEPAELSRLAATIGLNIIPVENLINADTATLTFEYNRVPAEEINSSIKEMIELWSA